MPKFITIGITGLKKTIWVRDEGIEDPIATLFYLLWQVIAIDHSGRLLDAAMKIQQGKSLEIKGARDLPFVNIPLDEIKANVDRVQFQQVCLMVMFKMVSYAATFVSSRNTPEEPCVTTQWTGTNFWTVWFKGIV